MNSNFVVPLQHQINGTIPLESLRRSEIHVVFTKAMAKANKELAPKEVEVCVLGQLPADKENSLYIDPTKHIVLGIRRNDIETPIDIIDIKALDKISLKDKDSLSKEMIQKVNQHLVAEQTPGILISSKGTKLDVRYLTVSVRIDDKEYLVINDKRIVIFTAKGYQPLKAFRLHSPTITRALEKGKIIQFFDEIDLLKDQGKGKIVNLDKIAYVAQTQLFPYFQADATSYSGEYFIMEQEEVFTELKDELYSRMQQFQYP